MSKNNTNPTLAFTSIKDNKILIKTGDGNRSSWRNITSVDGKQTVKYKKATFTIDTESNLIVAIDKNVADTVFVINHRSAKPTVTAVKPRWSKEQQAIIDNGASLIIEGTNYQAHDGVKICKCCNDEQSVENYFNKANQKDGKFPKCKVCDTRRVKLQRAKAKA